MTRAGLAAVGLPALLAAALLSACGPDDSGLTGPLPTSGSESGSGSPLRPEADILITIPTEPPPTDAANTVPRPSLPTSTSTTTTSTTTTTMPPPLCADHELTGAGFAPDSSVLPSSLRDELDLLIVQLIAHRPRRIVIVGHADSRPSRLGNDQLSLARAEAVKTHLVIRGVTAPIHTEGRGDDEPLDTAEHEQAWAKNRRIVLTAQC